MKNTDANNLAAVTAFTEYDTDETPQEAAERIWKSTEYKTRGLPGHDPIATMRLFEIWARQNPERMLAVITPVVWHRIVRAFLDRKQRHAGGSKIGTAFSTALHDHERKRNKARKNKSELRRRSQWTEMDEVRSREIGNGGSSRHYARKKAGLKVVQAEVNVETGVVVNLIDKEVGPFSHIKINGLNLPEATTEEALRYCDNNTRDVQFVRALCSLIPDPRKPIGEQWTVEMIQLAKRKVAE